MMKGLILILIVIAIIVLSIGQSEQCMPGEIRLVGGSSTSGRIEICYNNTWGTVCDDEWDAIDAEVACRQLNLSTQGAGAITSGFLKGTGVIWLDNLRCSGREKRLIDCTANAIGTHNCDHDEDAGLNCPVIETIQLCTEGEIRLVGGTATSGRIEICYNNTWGTVCDDDWDNTDAQVACRQLNLGTQGAGAIISGFLKGTGAIWLDNLRCSGSETRLIDCTANAIGTHNCGHHEDAGVNCPIMGTSQLCTEGDIRLFGGTATSGRIEICYNNTWGTVCDDEWDNTDAQVACRQLNLGIPDNGAAITSGFLKGTGAIWLDNLRCSGSENRLIDCTANAIGTHNCGHHEDAGVNCISQCTQGEIRLMGGSLTSGRVEVCNNNNWGTVCHDEFDNVDAQIACKQLNISFRGATAITSGFPNGAGAIWLDNLHCNGSENRLLDCIANPIGSHNCTHSEDAGVNCLKPVNGINQFQSCPSEDAIEELKADVYNFLYSSYGVSILGLIEQNPALSCEDIYQDNYLHKSGLYWIRTHSGAEQQMCRFG